MKRLFWMPFILFSATLFAQPIIVTENEPDTKSRHYRFPEFQKTTVILKKGNTVQALMNYNLLTEEMIVGVRKSRTPYPASNNIDQIKLGEIDYVTIDGKYYEVLYKGAYNLLVQRKMTMGRLGQNTGLGRTTNRVSTELPPILNDKTLLYQLEIPGEYSLKSDEFYYVENSGTIEPLHKLKSLSNLFPSEGDRIKKYIKEERLRFSREKDIIQAFKFCLK